MKFSARNITRLSAILAAALPAAAVADDMITETLVNPFSVALIASGLLALVVMRRRNFPIE